MEQNIQNALTHFESLLRAQLERADQIKAQKDFVDFKGLDSDRKSVV